MNPMIRTGARAVPEPRVVPPVGALTEGGFGPLVPISVGVVVGDAVGVLTGAVVGSAVGD